MATTAIAIDVMLPAFTEVREHFDLADNPARTGLIVSVFLGSLGLAQMLYGPLADRFGRKPILTFGLIIYVIAGVAATFAPTFEILLLARVVWGFAAAAPRIVSRAILRDRYRGDELSRAMSLVVAIFLVVPTIAPLIGQLVLSFGSWRLTFAVGPVFALLVLLWTTRLPETLPVEARRSVAPRMLVDSIATVFKTPSALAGTIALTVLFGAFLPYLSALERVFDDTYDRSDEFAYWFALSAIVIAGVTLLTERLVKWVGTDRAIDTWFSVLITSALVFVWIALANAGVPEFGVFYVALLVTVSADGALVPLLTSTSMEDVGHIAGTAASTIGAVSLFVGSILSVYIDRAIVDTVTPLGVGYFIAGVIGIVTMRWARTKRSSPATVLE